MSGTSSSSEIEKEIEYITKYVGDLDIDERREILQMIINSGINDSKIQTKGNGTQIRWKDITSPVVSNIYSFIKTKLAKKKEELESL